MSVAVTVEFWVVSNSSLPAMTVANGVGFGSKRIFRLCELREFGCECELRVSVFECELGQYPNEWLNARRFWNALKIAAEIQGRWGECSDEQSSRMPKSKDFHGRQNPCRRRFWWAISLLWLFAPNVNNEPKFHEDALLVKQMWFEIRLAKTNFQP